MEMRRLLLFKFLAPILSLLLITILAFAWVLPTQLKENSEQAAVESAKRTVSQFKSLRAYYTENIIKKVLASGTLTPSINHKNKQDSVPLPATMVHELSGMVSKDGTSIKLYSEFPYPNRSNRQLDDFASQAWKQLSADPSQIIVRSEHQNGRSFLRVAVADQMVNSACVNCHNSHPSSPKVGWKVGDVRGVLEVSQDITNQLNAGYALYLKTIIPLVIALIVIAILMISQFKIQVFTPLKRLTEAFGKVGQGDLCHRIKATGCDEMSQVANAFDTFTGNLQSVIREVSQSSDHISCSVDQLKNQTDANNKVLTAHTTETELIVTAIEEMSATTNDVASNASDAFKFTHTTNIQITDSKNAVSSATSTVSQLVEDIENTSTRIAEIEKDTLEITNVLKVIGDIADQTNLLALNAAIEAARAGDQGRGFAVVADEVRALAIRTQTSTAEIEQTLNKLRNSSTIAISATNTTKSTCKRTVENTSLVANDLDTIAQSVTHLNDLNMQIAAATEEQHSVADDITRNMVAIREIVGELSVNGEATANETVNLTSANSQLRSVVDKFKLQ